MTQNKDTHISGTITSSLMQNLVQGDEDAALEYLKADFLTSAVEALFYARRNANLTQEQVAKKLGKKQSAVARWEADFEGKMSLKQYVELALACGVMPQPIKFEPVPSARSYAIADLQSQWLQEFRDAFQVAYQQTITLQPTSTHILTNSQVKAASIPAPTFNQTGMQTARFAEQFLKEQRKGVQAQSKLTLTQPTA